ncbi:SRPBCC family protein [Luteolibacter sp. GHJ8]|uniref:SRPBCC family protein n=1 Tax=Luteolibacter rhizosphaerae TaxID=2989719 RepID=A0ABT3GAV9_9BACT|nr:SRPBCC family protein [Luteolibacter rhizosphaerae]MCW1916920.1 SRPBCC family protein [Luteolibacter rhizosphaerae]
MNDPKLIYVTLIRTTPARLWEALTNPDFIQQYWFGRRNTSSWKEGEVIESRSPEGELEWHGKILKSVPETEVVFSFDDLEYPEPPSTVTFRIEALGTGTMPQGQAVQLTVIHDDFPAESKVREGVMNGWPAILSSLKSLLETGKSLELGWKGDG